MIALVAATALSASPTTAELLEQAKVLYATLHFEECLSRLAAARQLPGTTAEYARVELQAGLCSAGLGQLAECEQRFELALRMDATLSIDRTRSSPKVIAAFDKARKKVPAPTPAPPEPEVEKPEPAPPPAPVEVAQPTPEPAPAPTPAPAPVVEAAPARTGVHPGVWAAAAAGVAALLTGTVTGLLSRRSASETAAAYWQDDRLGAYHAALGFAVTADVAFALTAVCAAAIVIILAIGGVGRS